MIKIPKIIYDEMLDMAGKSRQEEICGLLGGNMTDGETTVRKVYFTENTDHSPTHFSMNVKEQLAAVKDMRENGFITVGVFHSHPSGVPAPSAEDMRLAYDKDIYYFIISSEVRAFHITDSRISEEEIIID